MGAGDTVAVGWGMAVGWGVGVTMAVGDVVEVEAAVAVAPGGDVVVVGGTVDSAWPAQATRKRAGSRTWK